MKAENITYTKGTRLIPPDKLIKIIPNKENHKATFCFSTIISTHLGLPAALISLFFGFFRNRNKLLYFIEIWHNYPTCNYFFKM